MKLRFLPLLLIALCYSFKSYSQYKDLDGVFFGKVISIGVGASVNKYSDDFLGTSTSVTPITFSVILNKKAFSSTRLALHNRLTASFAGDDFGTPYTQTLSCKFIEFEGAYKFAVTKDGIDKPTSVFVNLSTGFLAGKQTITDSRGSSYGSEETNIESYIGVGPSVFQRLGSRFILFAEPAYRFSMTPKTGSTYLGSNYDKRVKFSHISGYVGIMFLIGKSN